MPSDEKPDLDFHKFSKTQDRLFRILMDGQPHSREELRTAIEDVQAIMGIVRVHICKMRPRLRARGLDVVSQFVRDTMYYRVIRLPPRHDE